MSSFADPGIGTRLPWAITAGPDGALWFTNAGNTDGAISSFGDTTIRGPGGIVAGPDGALWFANTSGNTIGHIQIAADPGVLLTALLNAVTNPRVGPGTSLGDKVTLAQTYNTANDVTDACATLNAFVQEVRAQTGKSIPAGDGASQSGGLITGAQQIEAILGC